LLRDYYTAEVMIMVDSVRFEILSDTEVADIFYLYLHDGLVDDGEFIERLRGHILVEHTMWTNYEQKPCTVIYTRLPSRSVELVPMIAPFVEQLVERQNAANAG
jgi:hypothetical protein